jgi:hypothetical protein
LLFPIVAVQTCLFAKPLLSNGCYIFAYIAVVAQQGVYMPQYEIHLNRYFKNPHGEWESLKILGKFLDPIELKKLFVEIIYKRYLHKYSWTISYSATLAHHSSYFTEVHKLIFHVSHKPFTYLFETVLMGRFRKILWGNSCCQPGRYLLKPTLLKAIYGLL